MEQLVITNQSGKDVTTSLLIAEVFNKRHSDVLRDIENLSCSQQFRERNFALSSYTSLQGKKLPMHEITKDGFSFLVMGYNGVQAGEFKEMFINEFNKREALLKNDDYIISRAMDVLLSRTKALESQIRQKDERLQLQESVIKEAAPKVEYYNEVLQSEALIPTTVIAKELGMSAEKLNMKLHSVGVQYKIGRTWVLYAHYQNKNYTGTKTHVFTDSMGKERTTVQTYWTESGRKFIHSLNLDNK